MHGNIFAGLHFLKLNNYYTQDFQLEKKLMLPIILKNL